MVEREKHESSRILVTGASGFIGRQVVPLLVSAGHEVHVLGRTPWAGTAAQNRQVVFTKADLLAADGAAFERVKAIGAERLLHLAWCAEPGSYVSSLENLRWTSASLSLIEAFVAGGGRRAVIAGTCMEYDWTNQTLDERKTPLLPSNLYGECKASLHRIVAAAAKPLNLSYAWGHIFFPYGEYEKRGRLLSDVIANLLQGEPALCSEGLQKRDFIYVRDAAAAFVALLNSNVEGAVNIASGTARPVREVVSIAARIIGRPDLVRFGARPLAPNDPPRLAAATDRLHREVGFQPRYDLESGLAATVDWWRHALTKPQSSYEAGAIGRA